MYFSLFSLSLCCTWQPFLFCLRLHENRKKIQQQPQNTYRIVKESNKIIFAHASLTFSLRIFQKLSSYTSLYWSLYTSLLRVWEMLSFPEWSEAKQKNKTWNFWHEWKISPILPYGKSIFIYKIRRRTLLAYGMKAKFVNLCDDFNVDVKSFTRSVSNGNWKTKNTRLSEKF